MEQHNFSIRKRTLEYDDVMNKQREIIYGFRSDVVQSQDIALQLFDVVEDIVHNRAQAYLNKSDEDSLKTFVEWANGAFPIGLKPVELEKTGETVESKAELVIQRVREAYKLKSESEDPEALKNMERFVILQAIDTHWQEYLRSIDALRQGIHLRSMGQRDPLVEYKREAYTMFSDLMDKIKLDIATRMFRSATSANAFRNFLGALRQSYVHDDVTTLGHGGTSTAEPPRSATRAGAEAGMQAALDSKKSTPVRRDVPKVGRNEPCPCGSGKKYKHCHGASA